MNNVNAKFSEIKNTTLKWGHQKEPDFETANQTQISYQSNKFTYISIPQIWVLVENYVNPEAQGSWIIKGNDGHPRQLHELLKVTRKTQRGLISIGKQKTSLGIEISVKQLISTPTTEMPS